MLTRRQLCSLALLPFYANAIEDKQKLFSALSAKLSKQKMHFVYSSEYPPYSFLKNGKASGLKIDLVNYLFQQQLGIQVNHEFLPWNRAQYLIEGGQFDAMVAIPTPDRARFTAASQNALYTTEIRKFVRNKDQRMDHIEQLSDLKPYKIGTHLGNSWARIKLEGLNVQFIAEPTALPRMLLANRFDVVFLDSLVMQHLIRDQQFQKDIRELPHSVEKANVHILIEKRSPFLPLLPFIDNEIMQMKQNGIIKQFIHYYQSEL